MSSTTIRIQQSTLKPRVHDKGPVLEADQIELLGKGLPHSFSMLIAGNPGSGKTNFIIDLLQTGKGSKNHPNRKYYNYFDNIWIWSASMASLPDGVFDQGDGVDVNIMDIPETATEFRSQVMEVYDGLSRFERNCFVFDDLIEFFKNKEYFKTMLYNRRHKGLSIIITSQYYTDFPRNLRCNISVFVLFNMSMGEFERFYQDMIKNITVHNFKRLVSMLQGAPHAFLMFFFPQEVPKHPQTRKLLGPQPGDVYFMYNKVISW